MTQAELKLRLFREIDRLPEDTLVRLSEFIQKISTKFSAKEEAASSRPIGLLKGFVIHMAEDFNEPI